MHDARAVANFFIDRAASEARQLTVMTLLKVIYFAHAWYLAKHSKPLIGQPFEAWKYGPVIRVIYEQCKNLDENTICEKLKSLDILSGKYVETKYKFLEEEEFFLNGIFDYYSKFHAYRLSDLTHEAGSPWDIVWRQAEIRAIPGMVIPNESIRCWFAERGGLYWTNRERERLS